ncbi:aspartate/glutamate racemase family protein [Halostreptopolyspora alba]|uniref:Aspartate/glutamate racemase family protein n=1 Tax=Halostreptopolyspora alba TaxID=2487137 RepID=A0A3N0EI26_9ACTN|nr:aspartate/glutamate racemase family protein [Nocardiopsaceae bacterium YIM 96095]
MRVIGMLGGMSWESTDYYYQRLNSAVRDRLGGLHSARCVVYSVDFAEIEAMQAAGDWDRAGTYLAECARRLEAAGAECVVLCTNTMHRVFGEIQRAVSVPMLHIADSTADALEAAEVGKVALLGTRYTMEQDFYRERLERRGLSVVVPSATDREFVHRTIFEELCLGETVDSSRVEFERIVADLAHGDGVAGVILGCTEIGLLLGGENSPIPVFDTTLLHVEAALDWSLR